MASTASDLPAKVAALQKQLKEIVQANGILDPISEVIVKGTGLTAENFGSTAGYATIKFKDEKRKPLHFFTKRPVEAGGFFEALNDWGLFVGEVEFFGKYLPKANRLCKLKGQEDLLNIYPKCYHVDDKLIVFENLVVGSGFIMVNKLELQDFEPAALALCNLAKHHALSYVVIKEHEGGADAFFRDVPELKDHYIKRPSCRDMLDPMFESAISGCLAILERSKVNGKEAAIEMLRSFQGKVFDNTLIGFKISPDTDEPLVVCHGDYHNNNMMFKQEDSGKFVAHKMVDMQTIWYGTPGNDVTHFLFACVKSKIRREKFHELLNVYISTLNSASEVLGHPINLTMPQLLKSCGKRFRFGFWVGMYLTQCAGWEMMGDIEKIGKVSPEEMDEKVNQIRERWMDENPERCLKYAEGIVEYVKEYELLEKA